MTSTSHKQVARLCAALLAVAAVSAMVQEPAPVLPGVALPDDLARVLRDYEAAWQRKDAAGLAALFTEDGFVLPSGEPPVRGRAQIEQHYAGAGGPLALRALAYATEGSIGYIIGAYAREPGAPDIGKFTLTLRKVTHGRWMIVSDMDNGNRRPAPAAAAPGAAPGPQDRGSGSDAADARGRAPRYAEGVRSPWREPPELAPTIP